MDDLPLYEVIECEVIEVNYGSCSHPHRDGEYRAHHAARGVLARMTDA